MARAELDRATFSPSQLQSRRISEIYGFDGTVWRRIAVDASGNLSVTIPPIVVASVDIEGITQVQTIETTTPLGGSTTFTGTEHDMITFESFGGSVTLIGGALITNVDVIFEQSAAAAGTKRVADSINLVVAAGATVNLNRVWSVTRRFVQIRLVNNTANALATTEVITMKKPLS